MYSIFKKFRQAIAIPGLLLFFLIFSGMVMFTGKGHSEELEPGHDSIPTWVNKEDRFEEVIWGFFQLRRGLYFVNKKSFERLKDAVFHDYGKSEKIRDPNFSTSNQIFLMMELAEKVLDRELSQPIGPSFQCRPHTYSDGATHLDCW